MLPHNELTISLYKEGYNGKELQLTVQIRPVNSANKNVLTAMIRVPIQEELMGPARTLLDRACFTYVYILYMWHKQIVYIISLQQ